MPSMTLLLRDYAIALILATAALLVLDNLVQLFGEGGLSSLGVIAAMAASLYAGAKVVERTKADVSSKACWIISLWLCAANIVLSILLAVLYVLIMVGPSEFGLFWQVSLAELNDLPPGTLGWIVPLAVAVSFLVTRLGFGIGVSNGLKQLRKKEAGR